MLTQARLKHLLYYDPPTGIWLWETPNPRSGRKSGEQAGSVNKFGYRILRVDCSHYRSARLAWFYMTGEWPSLEVDHINRDPSDDRWVNLRNVDTYENLRNRDLGAVRGIARCGRKFSLTSCGQYLGMFDRLEEARSVRDFSLWYNGVIA